MKSLLKSIIGTSSLREAFYWALISLFYVLDPIASASLRRGAGGVAIVRLDHIGDFILWLGSVDATLKRFEGYSITLIANSTWSELAEKLLLWDDIIPIDIARFERKLFYRMAILRKVARKGFRIAVNPVHSRSVNGDTIIRATHAMKRIGSVGDCCNIEPWQKRVTDRWYTELFAADPSPMMELVRNAEFVRGLGGSDCGAKLPTLPKVSELAEALRIERPYFIVVPGASQVFKQWHKKSFAELIDKVKADTGWIAVLCGSRSEHQLCADLAAITNRQTINLAGKTSICEFVEVIRQAKLLIGNDTSAVHIASAVGTPSVCILGGGQFGRFMPYTDEAGQSGMHPVFHAMDCFGCNWHCTQPHEQGEPVPCIAKIEVAQVFEEIKKIVRRELVSAPTSWR
jgi:ADP-heptose:LPS heptosyltransferase